MRTHCIRLKPGAEIKSELDAYVLKEKLNSAFIITCVGSVRTCNIRTANSSTVLEINECHEICSLVGCLTKDGSHIHTQLSDDKGHCVGGHVMGNMTVYTTAEIILGECEPCENKENEVMFTREPCSMSGWNELVIRKKGQEGEGWIVDDNRGL